MKNEIYQELNIKDIRLDKYQPRQMKDIDKKGKPIEELAQSIKERGQHIPVIVAPFYADKKNPRNDLIGKEAIGKKGVLYFMIDGERRYRALQILGSKTIKALIKLKLDERTRQKIQFEINSKREAVNPVDMAISLKRYIDTAKKDGDDEDVAIQELVKLTGMSSSFINSRLLILCESKEMQDHIREKSKRANAIAEIRNAERVFKDDPELQELAGKTLRDELLNNEKKSTLDARTAKTAFKRIKRMDWLSRKDKKDMIVVASKELKVTEDIENQDKQSNFGKYFLAMNSWKDGMMLWNLSGLNQEEFDKLISISLEMYNWIMNQRKIYIGAKTPKEKALAYKL